MTDRSALLRSATVTTASDPPALWAALMGDGGLARRPLWLVLLDPRGRPAPMSSLATSEPRSGSSQG